MAGMDGMEEDAPQGFTESVAEVRKYGVEPDFANYLYDLNSCSFCGQPLLIEQSRERERALKLMRESCPYCMQLLSKRTRARVFRWHFLPNWRPKS